MFAGDKWLLSLSFFPFPIFNHLSDCRLQNFKGTYGLKDENVTDVFGGLFLVFLLRDRSRDRSWDQVQLFFCELFFIVCSCALTVGLIET